MTTRTTIGFLSAFIALVGTATAHGQDMGCDALMQQAVTSGVAPGVTINPATGQVRMDVGGAHCDEPIEVWSKRDINVGEIKQNGGEKKKPANTAPDDGSGAVGIGVRGTANTRQTKGCKRTLADLFEGGFKRIGRRYYWLDKIVAIDIDNNGKTDNLAFTLSRRNPPERKTLYYMDAGEGPFAKDQPDLKLGRDSWIRSICLGDITFQEPSGATPPPDDPEPEAKSAEAEAKAADKAQESVVDRPPLIVGRAPETGSSIWAAVGIGVGAFVVIGILGGGAMWFLRRRKKAKGDEPEDEEGDEDDAEA